MNVSSGSSDTCAREAPQALADLRDDAEACHVLTCSYPKRRTSCSAMSLISRGGELVVLGVLGVLAQAAATDRGLFLKMDGPSTLPVEGDKPKVLRILQNLLLNAVKYTERGGISVSWGLDTTRDTERWTLSVQDTGPGLHATPFMEIPQQLHDATEISDEAREANTDRRRDMDGATTATSGTEAVSPGAPHGEGVGLSIVKRLCELLEESLELATKPGHGSTFRVILPCKYHEN